MDIMDTVHCTPPLGPFFESTNQTFRMDILKHRADRSKIVDSMSRLSVAFTVLDVIVAACDARATPSYEFEEWVGGESPPFTVAPLDIGTFTEELNGSKGWETLDSAKPTESPSIVLNVSGGVSRIIRRADDWVSYEIKRDFFRLSWYNRADVPITSRQWVKLKRRAAYISSSNTQDFGVFSTNCCIVFSIQQKYDPIVSSSPLSRRTPGEKLYFHRNPSLMSDY
ncbi:hypothetical protein BDV93DRAFT_558668 [Ceratobasidium sp. AG-I]|nr:hypothetical protein BDV93DRAFT_558668 [Ceratobasidium sp. AG-I]